MKVFILFSLLFVFVSARLPKCPRRDGSDVVLLPDPTSCSRFYSCSNGSPIRQNCPAGLHFNSALRVCDWPAKARCVRCPRSNRRLIDLLPDPSNCSQYYVCSNGVPVLQKCAPPLLFNARFSMCDWPLRAGCKKSESLKEEFSGDE